MRRTSVILLPLLGSLIFFGVGCVSFSSNGGSSVGGEGGIFKSSDRGDSWTQKSAIPTVGDEVRSISTFDIVAIAQDPQVADAVYIGTVNDGLFYTYDGGESWQQPAQVSKGRVSSIAVSSKNKCVVFAAYSNRLIRTEDCSRTWEVSYLDPRQERSLTSVQVDRADPNQVWVATDGGDVLRSSDGGRSWSSVRTFKSSVVEIALVASDGRRIFAATKSDGIWRSDDAGATWKYLSEAHKKEFSSSTELVTDLALGVSDPAVVIVASRYGLLRSRDYGDNWEKIPMLTPPKSTTVYTLAVDPKDSSYIYYGTATTFYSTSNGGINWVPKTMPTTRTATALMVDNMNSTVLYMGVTKFK
ncbi:hypothetical protein A2480_00745 [Candidatus Uhrbacteria bacterium RIFOXYC2_FULL_47_19]|uniref:Photosynthesis system II assembly factor Ycf48/Hcf136-like domain-containing protein n=1 Tax=Candidatus Uhrbacteria bacterium RIFOXYC2_FULL_47_19 TaxID=1802424 RepID=A0A1F7WGJ8_9BACT|nr:MAG: hypothetical protein A2480_00745 [Candidatus Uhrbacteria bacterium RIFOXYC2_FULL_47_19]HCC22503.1 hypothetical protein [Candidatus Uhrbacteria bacterium]